MAEYTWPERGTYPWDTPLRDIVDSINLEVEASAKTTAANTFTEQQTFDAIKGLNIGDLLLKYVNGFYGQRLHLTGISEGVMPYMEVAPTTRGGTDVGGAVAGFQLYLTPGGGGVPNREFLAIEASGENASNPLEFKISPWASGTGVLRPVSFWDGSHKVFTVRNNGGTGALEIQAGSRLTYVNDGTTATVPSIFQHGGTMGCQYRVYNSAPGPEAYQFLAKNRGSAAVPTPPISGDNLGSLRFGSIDAGTERIGVSLRAITTQTWIQGSAQGAKFQINTVPATTSSTETQAEFNEPGTNETGILIRVDRAGVKTISRVKVGGTGTGPGGVGRALYVDN